MQWAKKQRGFTIVELLIVIVVIAILAAVTIVAYNGIQSRAKVAAVQSAASQASRKILSQAVLNSDDYPALLTDVGVSDSATMTYQYTSNNTTNPKTYCVTATNGSISYYTSAANQSLQQGICPGHNLIVWDKTQSSTKPIVGATIDNSTFRTSIASLRIPPASVGRAIRDSPYTGTVGTTFTLSFWMKTDSGWDGTSGSSKVRFGKASDNSILYSCPLNGVKLTWVYYTCSWTLTAAATSISLTVGNDGTVGNIWFDDISLTRSE